ncbi:hypothetical protein [Daejeonella lutea]|uniref:hypothetical protein n=1 Tax=Daejeonella lutea TaxID=572036 RepID=UPI0014824A54|nr:hypothetical protein [Daejeonella lutea]
MKRIFIALAAVLFIAMTSCQKEEITPTQPDLKANPIECRKCTETWDIIEPAPPANP